MTELTKGLIWAVGGWKEELNIGDGASGGAAMVASRSRGRFGLGRARPGPRRGGVGAGWGEEVRGAPNRSGAAGTGRRAGLCRPGMSW